MSMEVIAIYEQGVLRPLTPISLPEQTRVRVRILGEDEPTDELRRAEAALMAAGLLRPSSHSASKTVSPARRAELARFYAKGGALSDIVIAERDDR
jgi:predicted DNA-binding antitoxin AbrB/MazE fold protein